jgi:hypothetical protein
MTAQSCLPAGVILVACVCLFGTADDARGQGACCLMDGCVPTADDSSCFAMGGFYFADEDCADDPCGVGACCSGPSCVMMDAYSCLMGARDFMGAGTQCSDDPCDIGTGACCTEGACTVVSEEDCTAGGGAWLGVGTICVGSPCVLGACCVPGDCLDVAHFECSGPDATFVPGADCSTDPCDVPDDCPADSLFSQQRDSPDGFQAYTSEEDAGLRRFDNFSGVAGPISALRWWGLDLDFVGSGFVECVESDNSFDIAFHTDAGGVPGPSVSSYTLAANRRPTGIDYLGAELNEYNVTLPEPCVLVHGWVSIVGLGDPECWFLWMSGGPGESYCEGCLAPFETDDLSYCLLGSAGGVLGACCDEPAAVCEDDVDIADCVDPNQVFAPDAACTDLDPPCGIITGACCFDDATCTVMEEAACAAQSGSWLGAHTICSYCPCVIPCPAGGVAEGEPECYDGYVDTFNGGCDAATPAFQPIGFCETVCGESGIFLDGVEITADFDWYEIVVESATELTWNVEAEFPVGAWIIDGNAGCGGAVTLASVGALECSPIALTVAVEPGTYWLVVAPAAADDLAACGARYTARATGTTPCLVDYAAFYACLTGPGGGLLPGCQPADLDTDNDVDLKDFAAFTQVFAD